MTKKWKTRKGDVKGDVKMMVTKHYLEIVVTKRTDDYHACIRDHPEIWGCGKDYNEAIGDLIRSHKGEFGIQIEYDTQKKKYGFFIVTCVNCRFKKFAGTFAGHDMIKRLNDTSKCCKKPNYDM